MVILDKETIEKRAEERIEKREKLSASLWRRNRTVDIVSFEAAISEYEKSQEEIQQFIDFLKIVNQDPKKVFTDTYKYKRVLTRGLDVLEKKQMKAYEVQQALADIAQRYFSNWLQENNITKEYNLQMRNPGKLHSILGVYVEGNEVLQLNIYEKYYGFRNKVLPFDEFNEEEYKREKEIDKYIEAEKERISDLIYKRDNAFHAYKGIKNKLFYFFMNKEAWKDQMNKVIAREESILEEYLIDKEVHKKCKITRMRENHNRLLVKKELESFFTEIGYKQTEDRYKLY